jgi:hypothetical protein
LQRHAEAEASASDSPQPTAASDDVIAELSALRARFSEPLRASCLVNYRRTAFEDPAGSLRITFDQRVACFPANESLWHNAKPLVREALGAPVHEQTGYILEVKARGELPAWLVDLLEQNGAEQHTLSKFVTASEAVYGALTVR